MANSKAGPLKNRDVVGLLVLFILIAIFLNIVAGIRTSRDKAQLAGRPSISATPTPSAFGNSTPIIALSPSGKYLAGIASGPLVIWDSNTKKELTRLSIAGNARDYLKWSGDTLITNYGDFAECWNWRQKKVISAPIDRDGNSHQSDEGSQYAQIDSVRDIKTHRKLGGGIELFRASTGQPLPLKGPTELDLEQFQWVLVEGRSQGPINIILASHTKEKRVTATPTPTPTPSSEMRKWQDERTVLLDNISDLEDELRETQSHSSQERQEAIQQITALQKQIQLGDNKWITPLLSANSKASFGFPGDITSWDARAGKTLWQRNYEINVFPPTLYVSPDRKILAVVGTIVPPGKPGAGSDGGLEFLDVTTGQTLSSTQVNEGFNEERYALWLPGHIFCVPDFDDGDLLSFFNAKTGKKIKSWPLKALALDQEKNFQNVPSAWTCDSSGTQWVFASRQEGWKKWTPSQIEAAIQRYKIAKAEEDRLNEIKRKKAYQEYSAKMTASPPSTVPNP